VDLTGGHESCRGDEASGVVPQQVVAVGVEAVGVEVGAVLLHDEDLLPKLQQSVELVDREGVPGAPGPTDQ